MTPTTCERCRKRSAVITAYWGPSLCRPCAGRVAELADEHDAWPPVPWTDADEEVIR
jgi:hypothetical protein